MRLIDADTLKENFPLPCEEWEMKGQQTLWDAREIRETIDLMPTIDAVPVVRCKECKHFDSEDDCDCPMDVRYSDFFCKMGERRTDE